VKYILLADDGEEYGPYTVIELTEFASQNRLVPSSRLRREDGVMATAGVILDCWKRSASQQQTYRPPVVRIKPVVHESTESAVQLKYATLGQRIAAFNIDGVFYFTLAFIVALVIGLIYPTVSNDVIGWIVIGMCYGACVLFYYYLSATPGKLAIGLRIVSLNGTMPTFGQIIGRTASVWLCGFPNWWGIFTGPEHRNLAEKWAGTATISVK